MNSERYEAIRYLPTYRSCYEMTMISLKLPKGKDISMFGNIFDIYCWVALLFFILLTTFLITRKLRIKDLNMMILSLLEPLLCKTSRRFINQEIFNYFNKNFINLSFKI